MSGGATFAEVLEQELVGFQPQVLGSGPALSQPPTYRPPHPLLFSKPLHQFRLTAYGPTAHPTSDSRVSRPMGLTVPSRAPRPLTARQRRALDELIALGAGLASDFTERELRSAYRTLARRYHPDRYPSSGLVEKARLARVFADLNENHRRLLDALREPATFARF